MLPVLLCSGTGAGARLRSDPNVVEHRTISGKRRRVSFGNVMQVIQLEEGWWDTVEAKRLEEASENKAAGPSVMPRSAGAGGGRWDR